MAGVQFNLLPDVKLEYIKSQRSKNLVITVALVASGAALVIFLLVLITVEGVQKKQLSNTNSSIATASQQLKAVSNLGQILTVQNQLQTLSTLHHQDHVTSRVFDYLPSLTPANAHISSLNLDLVANTLVINGTADSQTTVNSFIDALKYTTYKVGSQDSAHPAFSSVVETNFNISSGTVNFILNMSFDPQLFSNDLSAVPKLTVPQLNTTSAASSQTGALFSSQPAAPATGGGQ